MKVSTRIYYTEEYLPTKPSLHNRTRFTNKEILVDITEVSEDDFPVAAIVKKNTNTFSGVEDVGFSEQELFSNVLRFYNGKLWEKCWYRNGPHVSRDSYWTPEVLGSHLATENTPFIPFYVESDFDEKSSTLVSSNEDSVRKKTEEDAKNYLIFNGEVWKSISGEPTYEVDISGHLSVFYLQKEFRTIKPNVFSAMQKEQAEKYGKVVAARMERGWYKSDEDIIVKIPSIFSFRRITIDSGEELDLEYCLKLIRMKWRESQCEKFHFNNLYNLSVTHQDGIFEVNAQRTDGPSYHKTYTSIDDVLVAFFNDFSDSPKQDYKTIVDVVYHLSLMKQLTK